MEEHPAEVYPQVYCITLPLPGKRPGPVNAYLFMGEKVTLLDAGTAQTLPHLLQGLEKLGVAVSDIHQIILTHGHIDHYGGITGLLKKGGVTGTGPKILAHREDRPFIESTGEIPRSRERYFLRLMGIPLKLRWATRLLSFIFRLMAQDCTITDFISEGDEVTVGDYRATVVETPGHSKGSVCLFLPEEKVLFSGDHILPHITPNAFVMFDAKSDMPVRLSQEEFFASINKVEALEPVLVFPAHGKIIEDLQQVTEFYRASYDERDAKILKILEDGESSVYNIILRLFPNLPTGRRLILELYLAASEVFTHLQVLKRDNRVTWRIEGKRLMARKL